MRTNTTPRDVVHYVPFDAPAPVDRLDYRPNAVRIEIEHNRDRKCWRLLIDVAQRRDGITTRRFSIFAPSPERRFQLAAAPRFNARQLATYAATLAPHLDALATAYRADDRAAMDAIVGTIAGAV